MSVQFFTIRDSVASVLKPPQNNVVTDGCLNEAYYGPFKNVFYLIKIYLDPTKLTEPQTDLSTFQY